MNAVVIYESMYGNTHAVAEAIAAGARTRLITEVHSVAEVPAIDLSGVELLVVGGPTHVWGLSRASTRRSAADAARKPGAGLRFEPGAEGTGLREWLDTLAAGAPRPRRCACFDTRMKAPLGLSGSAGRAAARRLRRHGIEVSRPVHPFYVDRNNHLIDGELAQAEAWGRDLATAVVTG